MRKFIALMVGTLALLFTGPLQAGIYQDADGVWRQDSGSSPAPAPAPAKKPSLKTSTDVPGPKTAQVTLEYAVVFQEGPKPDSSYVFFTLRGKWTNNNPEKVTVHYEVYFYDASRTVLYVDLRFRDIDASTSTMAPQGVGAFSGEPTDDFDYSAVANIVIKYHVKEEKVEKIYEDVPLRPYE
jgi:hypothetical protein